MKTEQHSIITADEGMMLYDGETYSDRVYLGTLDSPDRWSEVPMSQYEAWLEEQEQQPIGD